MAIFKGDFYGKNARLRPNSQVEPAESSMSITIPAGVELAADDVLYLGKLGENVDVISVDVTYDGFDDHAAAPTFDTSFGVVPASTEKTHGAVTLVTSYQAFYPETTLVSANSGARVNIQKSSGGGTGAVFHSSGIPFPINATEPLDLVMVVGAAATTAVTTARTITARVKYQYAYPDQLTIGVGATSTTVDSSVNYPFTGSIVLGEPMKFDYNGNAP